MELAGYFGVIGRWWATLLISTWVAGLAGFFIASNVQPTYEGVTRLLVGPVVADVDVTRAAGALSYTYSELATAAPALEATKEALDLAPDSVLVARAIPNETTRILTIRAEHSSPDVAAAIANTLSTLLQERAASDVVLPEGQLTVIEPAAPNPEPIAPQVTLIAIVAAATGLIAAAVLVVLVEYFGTTVNSQRELVELTRVPVLGSVALGRGFRRRPQQPTIVEARPNSRAAAALRTIGTKVAFAGDEASAATVLVVGTAPRDGAADLALGLATVLARGGRRVALVDGDDHTAALTELLGLERMPGLTELLGNPERDPRPLLLPRPSGLSILPYGRGPTYELLTAERAEAVMRSLAALHDAVIVNSAPMQSSGHALVWARHVTGVVVGVERERAKRDDVAYTMENLSMFGAHVIGTVFLGRAPRSRRRGPPPDRLVGTEPPPAPTRPRATDSPPGRARPSSDRVAEAQASDKPPR